MSGVKRSNIFIGALAAILVALSVCLWLNRQTVQDWLVVRQFTPTTQVQQLTDRLAMTPKGEFLFYASEPVLSDADEFNRHCDRRELVATVLGCYRDRRIFVYQIQNQELDGIREVTAAHEMLHAAWDRLSGGEQERLAVLLSQAYERVKTPELEERMAYYERQQAGQQANELHSILATEFAQLGSELEAYYEAYFTDRQVVVALHDQYQSVFLELEAQAEALHRWLEAAAKTLNQDIAAHNSATQQLKQRVQDHNQALESVDRTNPYEVNAYNARRAGIEQEQLQLSDRYKELEQRRAEYSQKLEAYNEIVIHTTTLVDSIDSLRTPAEVGVET